LIPAYNEVSEFDVSNLFRSSHALSGLPGKGGKLRGRLRGRSSTGINDASLDSGTFGGGGKLTFSDPNDASLDSGTGIEFVYPWDRYGTRAQLIDFPASESSFRMCSSPSASLSVVMPPLWSPPYGSPNWSPVERFGGRPAGRKRSQSCFIQSPFKHSRGPHMSMHARTHATHKPSRARTSGRHTHSVTHPPTHTHKRTHAHTGSRRPYRSLLTLY